VPESPTNRPSLTGAPYPKRPTRSAQRSAVTNGTRLLPNLSGNSPWTRRAKDLIAEHLSDLGGVDMTSAAERSLVRRAAIMTVELERMESRFAEAEDQAPIKRLDAYIRASGNLRRILETLGIHRRAKDITPPTIDEISREIAAEQQAAEHDEDDVA
jgi:hypothetical protein